MASVTDFAGKKEYESMRRELHTLKGNAGTLGIERLAAVSKEMEKKLKSKDYKYMNKQLG